QVLADLRLYVHGVGSRSRVVPCGAQLLVARYRTHVRVDKVCTCFGREEELCGIVAEHDLAVQQLRVGLDELFCRRTGRAAFHSVRTCVPADYRSDHTASSLPLGSLK